MHQDLDSIFFQQNAKFGMKIGLILDCLLFDYIMCLLDDLML